MTPELSHAVIFGLVIWGAGVVALLMLLGMNGDDDDAADDDERLQAWMDEHRIDVSQRQHRHLTAVKHRDTGGPDQDVTR